MLENILFLTLSKADSLTKAMLDSWTTDSDSVTSSEPPHRRPQTTQVLGYLVSLETKITTMKQHV